MEASKKVYRSATTGDRGFMIKRGGKTLIALDRPDQVIEREYRPEEWIEESEHRPLLPHQLGRIYFEAEKHFLLALGDNEGSNMDWEFMTNRDRNAYLEHRKETDNKLVLKLHTAMAKVLDGLS